MKKLFVLLLCAFIFLSFVLSSATIVEAKELESKTSYSSNLNIDTTQFHENTTNVINNFQNSIYLYVDICNYSIGSEIELVINTSLSNTIENLIFSGEGFTLEDNFQTVGDKIYFSVTHISSCADPFLSVEVVLDNGTSLTCNLYGVVRDSQLFVNTHARFLAENTHKYYSEYETSGTSLKTDQIKPYYNFVNTTNIINSGHSTQSRSASSADTFVSGRILWTDNNGQTQPLRFCYIEVYKVGATANSLIYVSMTNEDGYYNFSFVNDTTDGLSDLIISVYAFGGDTAVYDSTGYMYIDTLDSTDIASLDNIPVGNHTMNDYVYIMEYDSDEYRSYCAQALQILQSSIYAATYYQEMKGENTDIVDVAIIYPHSFDTDSCFFTPSTDTVPSYHFICMADSSAMSSSLPSYASCDVVTHEYGHHVSFCEGITNSSGGWHTFEDMAEHYHDHYEENVNVHCNNECALMQGDSSTYAFAESECKHYGCTLAWSEGYACFFGELAQQYFKDNYVNTTLYSDSIPTFADSAYYAYNFSGTYNTNSISIENNSIYMGESSELGIMQILYDMYDSANTTESSTSFDKLALGHQVMWNYVMGSDANTFYEFIEYFKSTYTNKSQLSYLGEILEKHHLTSEAPTITNTISAFCPTVEFGWSEPNSSGYHNARKFQVNFYDSSRNLIGSTTPQVIEFENGVGQIVPNDTLWETVLNSSSTFYVSITVYELNGDINKSISDHYVTSYESAHTTYSTTNVCPTISYTSQMSRTLSVGNCYWFKFTAPFDDTFTFSTSGSSDTYGELFTSLVVGQSISGRLTSDDNSGDDNNFKISRSLNAGDTIYIRVHGANWTSTGSFVLSISSTNHVHNYNHSYSKYTPTNHKVFCLCGAYQLENHTFFNDTTGLRCTYCGYFTSGPGTVIKPGSIADETENLYIDLAVDLWYNKNKEEYEQSL